MLIKKILNNNVVITINDDHEEIIVMGKGIAYGKRNGDLIDISKVNKTFELSLKDEQKKMLNMLKDIPIEYMDTSDQIIQKAKKELKVGIDDSLYITLTDHIHTSIERYKEGVILKNQLLMEIKSFYRKEFELGMWATSGVGMCIGCGLYDLGIISTFLIVGLQTLFHRGFFLRMTQNTIKVRLEVLYRKNLIYDIENLFSNNNLNIIDIKYEKRSEIVIMEIEIKFPSKNEKYNLTNEILEKDYVVKLSYF